MPVKTRTLQTDNGSPTKTVTIGELAKLLRVSYETARRYTIRGLFTVITPCGGRRSGTTILIPRDEVDAFLDGGQDALTRIRRNKRQKY